MTMKTPAEVQDWLTGYLARMMNLDAATIDLDKPVQRYGLDSAAAVELVVDLSEWIGVELEPTVVFEHRTIRSLSEHVGVVEAAQ